MLSSTKSLKKAVLLDLYFYPNLVKNKRWPVWKRCINPSIKLIAPPSKSCSLPQITQAHQAYAPTSYLSQTYAAHLPAFLLCFLGQDSF